jgi:hypothetical protein
MLGLLVKCSNDRFQDLGEGGEERVALGAGGTKIACIGNTAEAAIFTRVLLTYIF